MTSRVCFSDKSHPPMVSELLIGFAQQEETNKINDVQVVARPTLEKSKL